MSYFNVTHCTYGDVYTYDSGRCVKSNLSHGDEICKISVLEDCELEVYQFSLGEGQDGDLLVLGGTRTASYTGSSGPEEGLNLYSGDLFTFIAGSSAAQSTSNGFDMCCTNMESLELRNGTRASEGIVYLNGQPICNDQWDTNDATVVCTVLGYDDGETANSSAFGSVPNNFAMNYFECVGDETSIWDCKFTTHSTCDSNKAAGVKCSTETMKGDNYAMVVVLPVLILAFLILIAYIIRWRNNRLKSHQHNQYDQLGIALQKQEEEKAATKAAATKQKASKDVPKDPARVSYQPLLDSNLPNFKSSSEEESVEEFPEDVEIIRLASDATAGNEASAPPAPAESNTAYEPPSYQP